MFRGGRRLIGAGIVLSAGIGFVTSRYRTPKYDYIVVGAGSGGCVTAYFLAKWLEPTGRTVLLLDSGDSFSDDPKMSEWFENWGKRAIAHETYSENASFLPAVASSHNGVGGCSTHDTRITYIPTNEQANRMANLMNWSRADFDMYLQTVLNMIPLQSAGTGHERFYDAIIDTLDQHSQIKKVNGDGDYKARILPNTAGYVSIAMFTDELRWSQAYLLEDAPKNLTVLKNTLVDKIIFDKHLKATSVVSSKGRHHQASTEIIITAGSLGTPGILQRSGIGPRAVLEPLGVKVLVPNDEVGHGVDHAEVPVMYSWLDKWKELDGQLPRGGPMAWPLALFFENGTTNIMAHFGISPPPYGGNEVTGTPNCSNPDPKDGFYAQIVSKNPLDPVRVVHKDSPHDFAVLASGVRKMVAAFEVLREHGIVGDRVSPPKLLDINSDEHLDLWCRTHLGTAYHWMSTTRATKDGTGVVDENFKVRGVHGLRVGSGAVLPEITEANPHLTIAAFSTALAWTIVSQTQSELPYDLWLARQQIGKNQGVVIRSAAELSLNLSSIAQQHCAKND